MLSFMDTVFLDRCNACGFQKFLRYSLKFLPTVIVGFRNSLGRKGRYVDYSLKFLPTVIVGCNIIAAGGYLNVPLALLRGL